MNWKKIAVHIKPENILNNILSFLCEFYVLNLWPVPSGFINFANSFKHKRKTGNFFIVVALFNDFSIDFQLCRLFFSLNAWQQEGFWGPSRTLGSSIYRILRRGAGERTFLHWRNKKLIIFKLEMFQNLKANENFIIFWNFSRKFCDFL